MWLYFTRIHECVLTRECHLLRLFARKRIAIVGSCAEIFHSLDLSSCKEWCKECFPHLSFKKYFFSRAKNSCGLFKFCIFFQGMIRSRVAYKIQTIRLYLHVDNTRYRYWIQTRSASCNCIIVLSTIALLSPDKQ